MTKRGMGIRQWLWRILRFTLLLAGIAGVVYWVKFAPVQVVSHRLERGSIRAEVMGTGTLEARIDTTISPKISGRIREVLVDQGDRVSVGDVLVRLDDEELTLQVGIAQANVEANAAAIERLKTDKIRTIAVLEQAQKSHDRKQRLFLQNAVSQEEIDQSTEALAIADAGASRAEAAIAEGQKELIAAEKTLEYHRARLKDSVIVAPFDGLIVKRTREPGDVVVPGSEILTLISTDELWISAWVDETQMASLHDGQTARVVFRSEPEASYPATVVRLGKEADRETREFIVDVRVLELPKNWAVGQRAETYIEVAEKNDVWILPAAALFNLNGQPGVYTNSNGAAMWRAVTPGLRGQNVVEVLEGIGPDEVIITSADQRTALRDGVRVVTR